jgi:hypothetical protein
MITSDDELCSGFTGTRKQLVDEMGEPALGAPLAAVDYLETGRPPRSPLVRAASPLAVDVDRPPTAPAAALGLPVPAEPASER